MINFGFDRFRKPVAFYPYTSVVQDPIIEINTWIISDKEVDLGEEDLKEFIDELLLRCDKLDRSVRDDKGYTISTRRDNKTVIAMTDGNVTLYFGRHDKSYYVGFSVWSEFGDKIDLSDLDELPKLK